MNRKPRRTLVALLLGSMAWSARGYADQPLLADLGDLKDIEQFDLVTLLETPADVWTAAKTEQKTYEAPAIITTVTREQIAVWGYRSVAEVLSHLLGFYLIDDHATANLSVRGVSGGPACRQQHRQGADRRAVGGVSFHRRQLAGARAGPAVGDRAESRSCVARPPPCSAPTHSWV
jgi:hypothetical protein